MTECHIDFESRSPLEPSDVGLYNYIFHSATEPLFLWYKIGEEEYKCWRIWESSEFQSRDWMKLSVPQDLDEALNDSNVSLVAFNNAFERYMLQKLGREIPVSRFIDPQVGGRYLSLPASLEVQGDVLGLPPSLAKDKHGKELIKLFSEQKITKEKKPTKKNPEGVPERRYYNDWNSHPKEWEEFLEYGKRDVVAEGELLRRMRLLGAMPLPPSEQALWLLDQKINDRGMPADILFVKKMYNLALRAKEEAKLNFETMTGVKNANSPAQIKAWAFTQGYPYPSLNKDTVASALKDPNLKLSDLCRTALKMRKEAASTSYQKLGKILESISKDGRLRGQFIFMGSSRCGRWSGNSVQLHNLARPVLITAPDEKVYDFEDQKVVREARAMIHAEDYDGIMKKYGTVLLVVKNLIRTVFSAETIDAV
jgi:DNA polymerase bacteriophage-type